MFPEHGNFMTSIPETFLDLFQKPALANLATLMADGGPQVTPIWIDYDGHYLLVNSAQGRVKNRNMARRAKVAVNIIDPENPYRYLMIRGVVADITEDGAQEHLDRLSHRYLGIPYPDDWRAPQEVRQIFKIAIERVVTRTIASEAFFQARQKTLTF